jgi:hypothetical protein
MQSGRAAVEYRLRGFGLSASSCGSSIKRRLAKDGRSARLARDPHDISIKIYA